MKINGYEFRDARVIAPGTSWNERRYAFPRKKPHVSRATLNSHHLAIEIPLQGLDVHDKIELLQGLLEQGQMVIIEGVQHFWGSSQSIIATCLNVEFQEEAPTLWLANCSFEYRGATQSTFAAFDVSTLQDFNDYELAGVTTIALPFGTTVVNDPGDGTNFAVVDRDGDPVVTAYDGLDTGIYVEGEVKQTTIELLYPENGHLNAVSVLDGTVPVTSTDHVFTSDITIQGSQVRVIVTTGIIEYRSAGGSLIERFVADTSSIKLIEVTPEYAALRVGSAVIEVHRGRDMTIHASTLTYLDSAGVDQETSDSDNVLPIGSFFVSSNAFFKTTVSKQILPQDGGDTHPSAISSPRFQFMTNADHKLEVLKRQ